MSMNIDIECISLLNLILQDSPKDRQFILCVLARSNSVPTRIPFHPDTDYPTFYGYSNSRTPLYLMGKGVLNNVPPEGPAKRLISSHYLSYEETIINRAKNWDINQKLWDTAKYITLDNKTGYKDAEVFLVFRDKALDYMKDYAALHEEELSSFLGPELSRELSKTGTSIKPVSKPAQPNWSDDFKWQGNTFVFGTYGSIDFNSPDRESLFRKLTNAKGSWVKVSDLKGDTDYNFVRPTISQIEKRFSSDLKKYVSIPSQEHDDLPGKPEGHGAYRIKFSPKP